MNPTLDEALDAARAAVATARGIHRADVEALARAREVQAAHEAEVARREDEEKRWEARYAAKLKEWIASGSKGTQPVLAVDAKAQQALLSARTERAASAQTVAEFEAKECESRTAVANAESAARHAALAIFAAERDVRAQRILDRDEETELEREELLALCTFVPPTALVRRAIPDPINTPIDELAAAHTYRTVGHRNALDVPVNELGAFAVREAYRAQFQQRLELLLAGDDGATPSPSPTRVEQQAA